MQVWWGIYDIAFYILSINWRLKTHFCGSTYPTPCVG